MAPTLLGGTPCINKGPAALEEPAAPRLRSAMLPEALRRLLPVGFVQHVVLASAVAVAQSTKLCMHRMNKRPTTQPDSRLLVNMWAVRRLQGRRKRCGAKMLWPVHLNHC